MARPKKIAGGRPRRSSELSSQIVTVRFTPSEMVRVLLAAGEIPVARWVADRALESAPSALTLSSPLDTDSERRAPLKLEPG